MNCRKCKTELNKDNWKSYLAKKRDYICMNCRREWMRDYVKERRKKDPKYRAMCNERSKKYSKKHPEKRRKQHRRVKLRLKYGITELEFDDFYKRQNGRCAICDRHQSELKRTLDIDHNHKTGEIRGLLCPKCNLALGGFQIDELDISLLEKAIQYLRRF